MLLKADNHATWRAQLEPTPPRKEDRLKRTSYPSQEDRQDSSQGEKMKFQLVCVIFILLSAATETLCAPKTQTEGEKGLASLEMQTSETLSETSGVQTSLRRSKRFNSHFPICTYCCKCCRNKGCGLCCRT